MADTKIEWAEKVWNPVTGCTPVSAGCQNCYAERMHERFRKGKPYSKPFSEVRFHPDRLDQPLRWRKPRRVFVCSMGDLFHDDVREEDIAIIFGVMALARQHIFMLLTKRPLRLKDFYDSGLGHSHAITSFMYCIPGYPIEDRSPRVIAAKSGHDGGVPWPLPNLWLGVSVEDQKTADERIPILLQTPAALRFVSVEPMLGRIDMVKTVGIAHLDLDKLGEHLGPHWVICGEESGPKRRLAPINAIEELRDQCVSADVPFFLKQMDVNGKLVKMPELDGKVWAEFPEGKD